ncbi:MAG: hypothetical protein SF339_15330 [Blastocatellia bacterium]|nr:hypothetical protein [Blastocatellia bacterium]
MNRKRGVCEEARLEPAFAWGEDLFWEREEAGRLNTNVVRRIVHHSPSGFEIGFLGAGPRDLALNALNSLLAPIGKKAVVKCMQGEVRLIVWDWHQEFLDAFLLNVNREAGSIRWGSIREWVKENLGE